MLPVARITDMHVCPMFDGPKPHVGGPILPPGVPVVLAGSLPVATMGNPCVCVGPPDVIVSGCPKVLVGGRPVARISDMTAHGGIIVAGCPNVLIAPDAAGAPPVALAASNSSLATAPRAALLAPKKQRYAERKALIAKGKASKNPKVVKAAEQLEKNNVAVEKAKLANDVYDPAKGPPEGWKNISDDPKALAKYELDPSQLKDGEFRAAVYEPDPAVFGEDMKTTVALKGTTFTSSSDWKNNLQQGMNMESAYYKKAVAIGNDTAASGQKVDMTGHSLGGGMASAASRASGNDGWTFNSAGLHPETVSRYGGTAAPPAQENIQAYQVKGDVLTGVQTQGWKGTLAAAAAGAAIGGPLGAVVGAIAKLGVSALAADAVGNVHEVEGSGSPVARHGMDQVIAGIEEQKSADQAAIQGGL